MISIGVSNVLKFDDQHTISQSYNFLVTMVTCTCSRRANIQECTYNDLQLTKKCVVVDILSSYVALLMNKC